MQICRSLRAELPADTVEFARCLLGLVLVRQSNRTHNCNFGRRREGDRPKVDGDDGGILQLDMLGELLRQIGFAQRDGKNSKVMP